MGFVIVNMHHSDKFKKESLNNYRYMTVGNTNAYSDTADGHCVYNMQDTAYNHNYKLLYRPNEHVTPYVMTCT